MTGFEPATPTLARWCSSQLSYIRANYLRNSVRDTGLEPVTSSVSGKRANQLRQSRLGSSTWNSSLADSYGTSFAATLEIRSRWGRESNPRTRLCRPLPHHSATPP